MVGHKPIHLYFMYKETIQYHDQIVIMEFCSSWNKVIFKSIQQQMGFWYDTFNTLTEIYTNHNGGWSLNNILKT